MNAIQQKAQLIISEPWNKSGTVSVSIQGQTMLDDLSGLLVSTYDEVWGIFPRYKGERIEDIWEGKRLVVNIIRVKEIPIKGDLSRLHLDQIEFFAIGTIALLK